jgi:hypothetical protein
MVCFSLVSPDGSYAPRRIVRQACSDNIVKRALSKREPLLLRDGAREWQLLDLCDDVCISPHMATNLSIDPKLIERALKVSGERTKKAAVTKALQEFIARRQQKRLVDLMGKLEWDLSYDYKAERKRG